MSRDHTKTVDRAPTLDALRESAVGFAGARKSLDIRVSPCPTRVMRNGHAACKVITPCSLGFLSRAPCRRIGRAGLSIFNGVVGNFCRLFGPFAKRWRSSSF
jgi:hypothetical protein